MCGIDKVIDSLPTVPTVVEIGSHKGSFVLSVLAKRPQARIIAVEASPDNYAALVNAIPAGANVECIHAAVGARTGTTKFYQCRDTRADSLFKSVAKYKGDRSVVEVDQKTMDDILPGYMVDLLRLDCYGAEYEIMRTFAPFHRARELVITWHCKPAPFNEQKYAEIRAYQMDMLEQMLFELVDGTREETGKHMKQTWRSV